MRDNNGEVLARYDALFGAGRITVLDLDAPTVDRATLLRAKFNLKTPDALHLASAIVGGAAVFLTGDAVLARCTDVTVEVVTPDGH